LRGAECDALIGRVSEPDAASGGAVVNVRITALVASVLCLAFLVSPAFATGPVTSPAAVSATDAGVTAAGIGVAQSSADPLGMAQTLFIGVQSTTDLAGVQAAADEMLAKLDAIKGALVKAGVPADGIRMAGLSINPMYGPTMGGPSPVVEKNQTPQKISALSINGNLTADVASVRLLVTAMNAATENGASTVNANGGKGGGPFGTVQPSSADLAKATSAAVANARTNAEALAAASGRKLGGIRSIASTQPPMMACCPPNAGWTVQVTVTFDYAP
jgi:uncharacterized protein YggE